MPAQYLHRGCRHFLCADCASFADETSDLLALRSAALLSAAQKVEELESELKEAQRQAAAYKEIVELSHADVVTAWLNSTVVKSYNEGRNSVRRQFARINAALKKLEAQHPKL